MQEQRHRESFDVTSGAIHITDPCYTPDGHLAANNVPAKNGTWSGEARYEGNRVSILFAYHESVRRWKLNRSRWVPLADIGVDSGQAGVFDGDANVGEGEYDDEESFYGRACAATRLLYEDEDGNVTEGPNSIYAKDFEGLTATPSSRWGIIEEGIVSSSGHGDGSYEAFVLKEDGKVKAMKIVFISEEEEWW